MNLTSSDQSLKGTALFLQNEIHSEWEFLTQGKISVACFEDGEDHMARNEAGP